MDFAETLISLEYELWTAMTAPTRREAFFEERLIDEGGLTVMAPLCMIDRETVLKEAAAAPPVLEFELDDPRVIRQTDDSALVVYMMTHRREGHPKLVGGVTSAYLRRDGKWWLAYHQVTPYGEA
ncbi:DUF4440 domain-containing protein [Actinomadura rugatobispora]|uniref:DUF4440 domain-containing protein n=1 Tax=Actinomadura rugatobispora TaxID=1994 RepID=A0ABW0ZXX5_9ACTN|nr:hypothetical protein GCM10010200_104080 [Actinomadura rugatobispora]